MFEILHVAFTELITDVDEANCPYPFIRIHDTLEEAFALVYDRKSSELIEGVFTVSMMEEANLLTFEMVDSEVCYMIMQLIDLRELY